MADPCVTDTPYIALDTAGSPAVLSATLRNPEETYSGTLGDDTTHNVTDTGVVHTLTQSYVISNAGGTAAMRGIVVCALNPIFVFGTNDVSLVPFARLTVGGVIADERDIAATGVDVPAGTSQLFGLGALVGQIDIAAGASVTIDVLETIKNIGASGQWSFRFGGSKMVIQEGF
jgi:hypothetical protein